MCKTCNVDLNLWIVDSTFERITISAQVLSTNESSASAQRMKSRMQPRFNDTTRAIASNCEHPFKQPCTKMQLTAWGENHYSLGVKPISMVTLDHQKLCRMTHAKMWIPSPKYKNVHMLATIWDSIIYMPNPAAQVVHSQSGTLEPSNLHNSFLNLWTCKLAQFTFEALSLQTCKLHFLTFEPSDMQNHLLNFWAFKLAQFAFEFLSLQTCTIHFWIVEPSNLHNSLLNLCASTLAQLSFEPLTLRPCTIQFWTFDLQPCTIRFWTFDPSNLHN